MATAAHSPQTCQSLVWMRIAIQGNKLEILQIHIQQGTYHLTGDNLQFGASESLNHKIRKDINNL